MSHAHEEFDLFGDLLPPDIQERRRRIWTDTWIDYPVATEGLTKLSELITHPRTYRPPCCLIWGETNNGKTSLARKFERMCNPTNEGDEEATLMPVVYVQSPPSADVAALYNNILRAIGAPFSPTWQPARKIDQVIRLLTKLQTRVLIVDELQSALSGNVSQRTLFMNVLKNISNDMQISIVGVGTKEALRAIQTDPQLGNRFEPLLLPRWRTNQDYATFIAKVCTKAEVKNLKPLQSPKFIRRIHEMTEGLTGETWKLMCRLIEQADEAKKAPLSEQALEAVTWTAPKERRASHTKN